MKIFETTMNMEELDMVSGGKYSNYVTVTDAIYNRLKQLGKVNGAYTRLPEKDAVEWLSNNIQVKAEFNTTFGFDFLNGKAVYKESIQSKAGARITQQEVLNRIAQWTPAQ